MKRCTLALLWFAFGASGPAMAGVNEGLAAYKKKDYTIALRELLPAAMGGNVQAQQKVWFMYANGQGTIRDLSEAAKWMRTAAEQGDVASLSELGAAYANGHGVAHSDVEAAKWYRLAALKGDLAGQRYLAVAYEEGIGVPQDHVESRRWYRAAAGRGDAHALYKLGTMYASGSAGVKSATAAYALWTLSGAADASAANRALKNRAVLANNMRAGEITEAEELARTMGEPGKLLETLEAYVK
ncbi:MAG: tetratricopeptide repeat protein [Pseudomonadota bacterium]